MIKTEGGKLYHLFQFIVIIFKVGSNVNIQFGKKTRRYTVDGREISFANEQGKKSNGQDEARLVRDQGTYQSNTSNNTEKSPLVYNSETSTFEENANKYNRYFL